MKAPVIVAACLIGGSFSVTAQDFVHLKTGESTACEIEAITDKVLILRLPGVGGAGSAKRTLKMDRVDFIEFGYESGEEAVFKKLDRISAPILETWWVFHLAHLHRPRSRAAAYGIALGDALLRESPGTSGEKALTLFDRVIKEAWAEEDKSAARRGRLRALIAMGNFDTAVVEAELLASESEDPDMLLEVKYLLAAADFERLKALQEEHPKWMEDDEVRPERNEIYHRIIDQYLWPHLFHATRAEEAARGLLAAGDVYAFAGEVELARAAYLDLGELYPESSSQIEAAERLSSLSSTE
ncbi:MAG: hypothetical protein P1U68_15835 [Verrucomicrobiales bacterium]|nr:hypothetical protein [Verrucomicrobiales bacterium]